MKNKMPKICVFLKYPCYPTKCTATFQVPIQKKKECNNPIWDYFLNFLKPTPTIDTNTKINTIIGFPVGCFSSPT